MCVCVCVCVCVWTMNDEENIQRTKGQGCLSEFGNSIQNEGLNGGYCPPRITFVRLKPYLRIIVCQHCIYLEIKMARSK